MWDDVVDCEGLLCPLPVLRARKRLMAMEAGQVLCVRATDGMARVDLPHFCGQAGHEYLECREEGAVTLHLIRRGDALKTQPAGPEEAGGAGASDPAGD